MERQKHIMEATTTIHRDPSGVEMVPVSKKILWAGRIVSALPVLMLLMSGITKVMKPPFVMEGFKHLGLPEHLALGLGILELVMCPLNSYTLAAMDFWLGRGVSDEHIRRGSVRSEQRSMSQKDMPPFGLRRVWLLASLRLSHSPTARDAPSLRLASSQTWRNQCVDI
jgi:hypothetical protein